MFEKFKKEEILLGSLTLFIMINLANFLNYIFYFSMGRMLSPEDYGILSVLMAIVYVLSIPAETIQTVVSRYTTSIISEKEKGKIKNLFLKSIKKGFKLAGFIFVVYTALSFFLSYLLKIKLGLLMFTGFFVFCVFSIPVVRGILQGRRDFKKLGLNCLSEGFFKVMLAVLFVFLGLKVYGALIGVIFSPLLALVLGLYYINDVLKSKEKKAKTKGIYNYSFPVFIVTLSIILMVSLDVIFAKIFFSPEIAGKYAVASTLGKIIFFGTFAISKAMFPLTSERFFNGKETNKLFIKSFLIVLGLCAIALLVYALFPSIIVFISFGRNYLEIANLLIFVGLAFSFLSLSNISLIYALSLHKKKTYFFLVFVLIEGIILSLFHKNLIEFSLGLVIANFIMFVASLIFVINSKAKDDKHSNSST